MLDLLYYGQKNWREMKLFENFSYSELAKRG